MSSPGRPPSGGPSRLDPPDPALSPIPTPAPLPATDPGRCSTGHLVLRHRWFFVPYALLLLVAGMLLLLVDKGDAVVAINGAHGPIRDTLFRYATHIGYGWVAVGLGCVPLLWSYRGGLTIIVGLVIAGIFNYAGKTFIAPDAPRPRTWFETLPYDLHMIEGVRIDKSHSFPSGHTAAAFALFCGLAIIGRSGPRELLFLVAALLIGLSRIYLGQHFLVDVYAGSINGVASVLIARALIDRFPRNAPPADRGLLR